MKRVLLAASLAMTASTSAIADTVLGLYLGAEGWNMSADGGFANNSDLQQFNFDDETQGSFYVALEHPVPLIPNIKV